MLENIKACLFDMDGTVLDSMWVWGNIDIDYLKQFGVYDVPENMGKEIEGASMREVAIYFKEHFDIPDSIDKIVSDWNDMAMYRYANLVTLKPHIKEFLECLKDRGIKIGLCTSNSLVLAEAGLKNLEIFDYFDAITTGCIDIKGKPEPDIYLVTADKLGVKPENCLVFEDLVKGLTAGINAGMKTVAVKDDYSDYQLNEKIELADYYIEDYDEFIKNL